MIVYFGRDERGYFVDREDGAREYVNADLWMEFVRASSQPAPVKGGTRLKLRITEQVTLDKFDGDIGEIPDDPTAHPAHVERLVLTPETTEIG